MAPRRQLPSQAERDSRRPLSRAQVMRSDERPTDVRPAPVRPDDGTQPSASGSGRSHDRTDPAAPHPHRLESDSGDHGTEQGAPAVPEWHAPPGRMSGERAPPPQTQDADGEYITGSEYASLDPRPGEDVLEEAPADEEHDDVARDELEAADDDDDDEVAAAEEDDAEEEVVSEEVEAEDEDRLEDLPLDGDDTPPPLQADENSDIYGEDDYPAEDESFQGLDDDEEVQGSRSLKSRSFTRSRGRGATRVAPVEEPDEEDASEATRAGPPFRLEIVRGPDAGRSKRFRGVRMVVGRVKGCELKLSDASVSRRHLELIQGEKGVLLRDLGSGNGTKVNREKVTEVLLKDGDEIAIGKTRFRFVDEVAQYKRAREEAEKKELEALAKAAADAEKALALVRAEEAAANPPAEEPAAEEAPATAAAAEPAVERKPLVARLKESKAVKAVQASWGALSASQRLGVKVGAVGTVLALAITFFVVLRPEPKDPKLVAAEAQLAAARGALERDELELAVSAAERAAQIYPGSDKDGLGEKAKRELAAEKTLKSAQALLGANKFLEAQAELQTLSAVSPKRNERAQALRAEVSAKNDDYLYGKAKEALALSDADTAQQIIAGLTPPRHSELTSKLVELRARLENDRRNQDRVRRQNVELAKRRDDQERAAQVDMQFMGVARKFNAGDFERATLECDRVAEQRSEDPGVRARSLQLRQLIPAFARNFEDGQRKFKAGALGSAIRPLRRAREVYQQIGFTGALGTLIDEELASALLMGGKDQYSRADYVAAAGNFREALKLNPSEERAKEGLQRLAETAEELYAKGYEVRDSDPREARRQLKIILDIAPVDSTVYHRAKEVLASMQP